MRSSSLCASCSASPSARCSASRSRATWSRDRSEGVGVGGAVDGKEGGGGEEMKSEQPEWVNEEGGLG